MSPSLNLRLRADATYARHEGQGERAKLMEEAADEIARLNGIIENMREIRVTTALGVEP